MGEPTCKTCPKCGTSMIQCHRFELYGTAEAPPWWYCPLCKIGYDDACVGPGARPGIEVRAPESPADLAALKFEELGEDVDLVYYGLGIKPSPGHGDYPAGVYIGGEFDNRYDTRDLRSLARGLSRIADWLDARKAAKEAVRG